MSQQDIPAELKSSIAWVVERCNEPENSYTVSKSEKGFKSWKKYTEDGGGIILLRAQMEFPGISAAELDVMLNNFEVRAMWDTLIQEFDVIEKVNSYSSVTYYNIPPPGFMVKQRDFLNLTSRLTNYEGMDFITYEKATQHPSKPPTDKYIRAQMVNCGCIIRQTATGSTANLIVQVSIGGWVPQWLVNLRADDGPYTVWKKIMEMYPQLVQNGTIQRVLEKQAR